MLWLVVDHWFRVSVVDVIITLFPVPMLFM